MKTVKKSIGMNKMLGTIKRRATAGVYFTVDLDIFVPWLSSSTVCKSVADLGSTVSHRRYRRR
jgi:arginase family enzyme